MATCETTHWLLNNHLSDMCACGANPGELSVRCKEGLLSQVVEYRANHSSLGLLRHRPLEAGSVRDWLRVTESAGVFAICIDSVAFICILVPCRTWLSVSRVEAAESPRMQDTYVALCYVKHDTTFFRRHAY